VEDEGMEKLMKYALGTAVVVFLLGGVLGGIIEPFVGSFGVGAVNGIVAGGAVYAIGKVAK